MPSLEETTGSNTQEPIDPGSLMASKEYRQLLVVAALIGIVVSVASWGFLEAIRALQVWIYQDAPGIFGFSSTPTWWALPILLLSGILIAFAVEKLPGTGGHEPTGKLGAPAPSQPVELPGIILAALASISLGMVLGPEAPLIALGTGLAVLSVKASRKEVPDQALALLSAAGAFAAVSSLFGSPVVGAIIIIEAAGLGGATLPVILLPGLLAGGIGSLVFIGMGSLSGLDSSAYAIAPLVLPEYAEPTIEALAWVAILAIPVAVVAFLLLETGRRVQKAVNGRPFVVIPVAAVCVAALAIAFGEITGESQELVLFSGQDSMGGLVNDASTFSLLTLALLIAFKGGAYAISLGSARGGPTFPAMFLGIVAGLLASHLPGLPETAAVAALMAAATVAVLRLPLSSIIIAMIVSQAPLAASPLIVVAVVVSYVTVQLLTQRFDPKAA